MFSREDKDSDLHEEIQSHLNMATRDRLQAGQSAPEAHYDATREFGNIGQVEEATREMWAGASLEVLLQDLTYGFRTMMRSPGFSTVAILTLALGIAANTTMFSIVNGVLLNPLPFPNSNRIVLMFQDKSNFPKGSISYPNFQDWQRENRSFESMAAYRWSDGSITGVGEPESVKAQRVTSSFFPILGVNPVMGRIFTADEDRPGSEPVVLISEGLWKRKFNADPKVIGKSLIVGGEGRTIIGVVPASFDLKIQNFRTADLYVPLAQESDNRFFQRDAFWGTNAIALLKPGVTAEQAEQDMKRVNADLAVAYPDVNSDLKARISPLKEEIVGEIRPVLWILLGAVAFVLLIGCVNIANLLLARSTSRRREMAIRVALGAGQARIVRQLLTESLLLAVLGGGIGLLLAKWGTAAALAAVPTSVPRAQGIALDWRVLLFTCLVSVAAALLFGLVPALRSSAVNVGSTLKDTSRAVFAGKSRMQSLLVAGEMAMALVLLIGAGLMIRTVGYLLGTNPGFDPRNVVHFGIALPREQAQLPVDAIRAEFRKIHSQIERIPGVQSVSLASGAYPMESDNEATFWAEGQPHAEHESDFPMTLEYDVEPEYFQVMRISLLRGRLINATDIEHSAQVGVIDEGFAKKYFPGENPIGKTVRLLDYDALPKTWIPVTVVGVVGHVSQFGLAQDFKEQLQAQLYRPYMQASDPLIKNLAGAFRVYVRSQSSVSAESFFQTIRSQLLANNAQLIVSDNQSEQEVVGRSIARQRFAVGLLGVFAGFALLLASVGIYGVLSYLVGQRTQEIGVRMALGAKRTHVLRMVMSDGARMLLAGVAAGFIAAMGITRLLDSLLFGVRPTDPITFVFVATVLLSVALLACYIPARRAMRVDPMVALRCE